MQPAMAPPNLFSVCRLNDTNEETWRFKREVFLKKEPLWSFVLDAYPSEDLEGEDTERGQKALACIVLSLEEDHLAHPGETTTAKE